MREETPPLRWGHININVSDLDRAIAFYRLLGFETLLSGIPYLGVTAEVPHTAVHEDAGRALGLPPQSRARACIMQLDDGFPKIDLTELATPSAEAPLTSDAVGIVRICLASRNLRADYERLSAQGVPFLSPPQQAQDGLADVATCTDPDGTLIELIQIYPERWTALR
jgi:catechol 2,3-dioxygenase-like lactoylglutathione lyase family enzyme